MKRLTLIVLCMLLGILTVSTAQNDDGVTELVAGNNAFAFDYFQEITSDENLIFSPTSISQAFGMLMAGAQGNTEQQIADVMHYTLPQDTLHPAFSGLNTDLNNREDVELNIANSIWAQDGYPFYDAYMTVLNDYYNGGLNFVDYVNATEEARLAINEWIEEQTEDKIQDMIPSGVLDPSTVLVLVNTIYFKNAWMFQFPEYATLDDEFNLLDGTTVTVPMMSQQETLNYLQGESYQAVEMPYADGNTAMLIILPDDDQFETVQAQVNNDMFDTIRNGYEFTYVKLDMPKFKIETALDLIPPLKALGMTDVFDDRANLRGMADADLFVSAALHNAFIEVDELGTEAAAATVVAAAETSMQILPEPIEIRLDRPFIYTIYDRQTGSILFMGQVMNPEG